MRSLAGCLAIVFGGSFLLLVLPLATVQHPSFHGLEYLRRVVISMFAPPVRYVSAAGLLLILSGVGLHIAVLMPRAEETPASRTRKAFTFFGLLAALTLGLLLVLVGIAHVTLG